MPTPLRVASNNLRVSSASSALYMPLLHPSTYEQPMLNTDMMSSLLTLSPIYQSEIFRHSMLEFLALAGKFFIAGVVWELGYISANTLSANASQTLNGFLIFTFTGLACCIVEMAAKLFPLRAGRFSNREKLLLLSLSGISELFANGSWQTAFNLTSSKSCSATAIGTGAMSALMGFTTLTILRGIYTFAGFSANDAITLNTRMLQEDFINGFFLTLPANALFTLTNCPNTEANLIFTPPEDEKFTADPATFFRVLSANGGSMVMGLMLGLAVKYLLQGVAYQLTPINPANAELAFLKKEEEHEPEPSNTCPDSESEPDSPPGGEETKRNALTVCHDPVSHSETSRTNLSLSSATLLLDDAMQSHDGATASVMPEDDAEHTATSAAP